MKKIAIIPAYNEQETICSVINELKQYDVSILVVDDGSVDSTSYIARKNGAVVITLPSNQGIGVAMKTGYKYALENNYDIAIQVDADGQHDIKRINELTAKIESGEFDMVIGSRYCKKTQYESTVFRYMGIKYCSALIRVLHNTYIKDPTSGYRAINKQVMGFFVLNYINDYPEVPSLSLLLLYKYRVCEVSVDMKKRQGGRSSISNLDAIVYFLRITIMCFKNKYLYKKHSEGM